MAATESQLISANYQKKYDDLTNQLAIQQKSIDTMNNIQDKVGGIKDDLVFSVKTFKKQINDIRNQINIDQHEQVKKVNETVSWLDSILNFLIIVALLVAIVAVFRNLYTRYAVSSGTTIVPTS
jgi:cell division protein FtsX